MLWKDIVIDGLGINISFYSVKGLGGDAKCQAGVEISVVSGGYGHTTTIMARNIYLEKKGSLAKSFFSLENELYSLYKPFF